ncbi:MAG: aminotransferase class IV, partial [Bdellovibrionales bacterium]|nr:aminotransferase class IV [Bdellovibrionales bacterium]
IELTGFRSQDRIFSAVRLTAFGRSINSSSPKPPRHNLPGLNRIDTHAMAIAICKDGVWSPTTILPSGGINFTSANTTALQYSQQGFEGAVAVYDGDASISLFRIDANAERLQETARAIGVAPVPVDQIVEAVRVVVELNRDYVPLDGGKLYIRPCLLGLESNGANSAKTAMLVVEAFPYGDYLGKDSPGISVVTLLDKSRPPSGAAKLGANYGVDFQLKTEVKKAGFGDFMSIDLNGNVQELSTAALVFVQNNGQRNYSLCSPYVAGERPAGERVDVLNSITRRSVLELAKVFGVEVEKRDIHHSELGNFASLFSTGTAMGITRVNSLDVRPSFTHETMKRIDYSSDQTAISLVGEFSELIAAARQGQLRSTVERWLKDEIDSSEYLHVKVVGMQSDAREGLLRALEALDARWAVKIPLGRDHL